MNLEVPIIKNLIDFVNENKILLCYGINDANHIATFVKEHTNRNFDAFLVNENVPNNAVYLGIPIYNINLVAIRSSESGSCGCILLGVDKATLDAMTPQLRKIGVQNVFLAPKNLPQIIVNMLLQKNAEVKNTATKERCFILATGPSTLTQDLALLKDDDVFSCSYVNLMKSYEIFKPKYYVKPAAANDGHNTDYIIECLKYTDKYIESEVLFLDYNDKFYIEQYGLLKNKKVFYLLQNTQWIENQTQIYPLTAPTPIIWTASVMMLKVALYMGYKKIYLLGTEHNITNSQDYAHAYDENKLPENIRKYIVSSDDNVQPMRLSLYSSLGVYTEYYHLHNIAKANGVEIFNATNGGMLDEFPRVKFESLF